MCGINHSATDAAQGNAQSNAMSALLPLHAEFNLAALPSSRFHHFSPHMPAKKSTPAPKSVEVLKHLDEKRRLIPSAEQQSIMHKEHELLRQIKERHHDRGTSTQTSSLTSTASPKTPTKPNSTSTTRTGPTA